jgi:hypothetical protein
LLTVLQAGSDSLLTANVFYEMRRRYFEGACEKLLLLLLLLLLPLPLPLLLLLLLQMML